MCNGCKNHATEQSPVVWQHIEVKQMKSSFMGPSLAARVCVSCMELVPMPHSDKGN